MLDIRSLKDFDAGTLDDRQFDAGIIASKTDNARPAVNVVTKLAAGVRDPNRINVFIDGKFAFSLDVAQVVELQVKIGQKLSADRMGELRNASEFGKLYQRTLEWVLMRPHLISKKQRVRSLTPT